MRKETTQTVFLYQDKMPFVNGAIKVFLDEYRVPTDTLDITTTLKNPLQVMPQLLISDAKVLLENPSERAFLYDCCIEQGTHFLIVDDKELVNQLMEITSPAVVAEKFVRPINAKEVAQKVVEILENIRNRSLRKTILVVDDSPTFLRTASEWLEEEYNVCVCPSAFAAIKLINVKKPDMILLDYEMPVCSGAQFLEMMNVELGDEHPPVMFLTSKNDKETVQELLALKPQGYMLKTQAKESILTNIRMYFEKEM
ncbi:Response regulator receiver domain-containing protein [Lachnospiraceae bacterium KHCPX20]|jgi:CheY-like chemotaxis protein|nr:Response regulator receiver domain-containing protein [Lachnospiraceae bacterium KHCPX20]